MKNGSKTYCKDCEKSVGTKAHALQCDRCDEWLHSKCAGIPSDLYSLLRKYSVPRLKLFCKKCEQADQLDPCKLPGSDSDDSVTNITCVPATCQPATPMSSSTPQHSPVKAVPSQTDKYSRATYAEALAIPKRGKNLPKASAAVEPTTFLNAANTAPLQELVYRVQKLEKLIESPKASGSVTTSVKSPTVLNRDRCLIIMHAPEPTKDSAADRILEDQEFLQNMVAKLFDPDEDGINAISAFRLGRKSDDPSVSPRPLKVVLDSSEACRRVFSRVHRLKGESYRVLRDLSPEDRVRMRQAVQELKERKLNGESNLCVVDFRVVVRRPRVVWRPVVLLPMGPSSKESQS